VIDAIRSEIYKLRTTPGPWVVLLLIVPLTVLSMLAVFGNAGGSAVNGGLSHVRTVNQARVLLGASYTFGAVLAPIAGVLCITTEYRHKVITTSLLMTPRREIVLIGKGIASGLWGVAMAVLGLAAAMGIGVPWNSALGGSAGQVLDQMGAVLPGLVAVFVLLTLFGLGFGTLVRNQVAAVLITIGGTLVLEPIVVFLLHHYVNYNLNWLPTDTAASLAGTLARIQGGGANPGVPLLPWWGGGLALLAWGVVPLVVGYFTTFRRDVT
jgi:ABC-type transport system involved in multi-copper enzyme maturation permease subunit